MNTRRLQSMPLESSDFRIEPELVIKLAKRGSRIFEVPISYSGRTYQEGKKIGWRDGLLAVRAILKYAISDRIYTEDVSGSEILVRLSRAPRFTDWMADTIRPYIGDRVLEIGAGIGNITIRLIPRSVYWATEVNSQFLDGLHRLSETRPYLRTASTDITSRESFPDGQQFDTVVCLNVLEHVQDDVDALRNVRSVLAEGGRAGCPRASWTSPLRKHGPGTAPPLAIHETTADRDGREGGPQRPNDAGLQPHRYPSLVAQQYYVTPHSPGSRTNQNLQSSRARIEKIGPVATLAAPVIDRGFRAQNPTVITYFLSFFSGVFVFLPPSSVGEVLLTAFCFPSTRSI